jgi:hypothetical protein
MAGRKRREKTEREGEFIKHLQINKTACLFRGKKDPEKHECPREKREEKRWR